MKRKQLILIVLLGGLVISLIYAFYATPRQEKAPQRTVAKRSPQASTKVVDEAEEVRSDRVSLELLNMKPKDFPGAKRDIFQFGVRRAAKPVAAPAKQVEPPKAPEVIAPPVAQPLPAETMQRALAKFTFLGFLDKGGEKTIFLSSSGNLFTVKRGEYFGANREFLVGEISDQLLTVKRIADGQEMRVPLVENQQLQPAVSAPARPEVRSSVMTGPAPPVRQPQQPWKRPVMRPTPSTNALPEMENEPSPEDSLDDQPPEGEDVIEGDPNVTNE